ncbi:MULTISPECIES: GAF domain-containing protein [Chryseobacterium]|jgi:L-methionine (R)-S-oxide reductase|uniref:GAF domain-containing protein n=1 Tax=Chryseobacterium scophthalmum TaxID=59733 RepID=A0A1N6FTB0_9FLAO|nr:MULTISPECIES: GAF domain-containing protein [Chryseobacterium]MBM7421179.1 GAF domain-containing protein [Chryseobacterium sp. JUb44]MBW3523845.1 GAF domain-containing protein [Chryseobacterium sp. NKUCC03_KSP]MCD0457787.1 GAF domain-containing protein [Chryseobacterium sp. LC2016-27]MDH6211139.1 L-methionine (R)-S-oxide reductase [Chryseobacterium sp. BIGb0186]WSO09802.1 GAF domain-containing protein [Chryseobacterium scophthalmum]
MSELKKRLSSILESPKHNTDEKLQKVCHLLDQEISYFNWTGFYFKNGDKDELKLGPYVGAETDHTIIPYGKGICGQVAVSNETFIVPDVHLQDNYLSCSIDTKAEIVVPIFKNGENIGQIDIDSHTIDPFTKEDLELLEWLCNEVSKIL